MKTNGLHHVTAIAGDPQRNLDFYVGVLGLHLVKRTVNFDDPGSYHFYYGDATGAPGTILTFFPWAGARRGRRGAGEVGATAFRVGPGSLASWQARLRAAGATPTEVHERFGEEVIRFADPDGMPLELVAADDRAACSGATDAITGLHSVSAMLTETDLTARLLTEVFGYRLAARTESRSRFLAEGRAAVGQAIDLVAAPDAHPGMSGAGSVHHIAFRAADAAEQLAWREELVSLGFQVSPVRDRTYFQSIYFREPGGILFEIATDSPGFTTDEAADELGQHLRLPAWMERSREMIEASLPETHLPATV